MLQKTNSLKKATAVIPAYNEEATVAEAVKIARKNPCVNEVIVVDDGSTDNTRTKAEAAGAKVIRVEENRGKANAMDEGVGAAKNEVICFLDADFIGLKEKHLEALLSPVLAGKADMNIGIRRRKNYLLNRVVHFFPLISGERALTKDVWRAVPEKYKKRFEIEIALNYHAKKMKFKTASFYLRGVDQVKKEKKHGLITGLYERLGMAYDILSVSLKLYVLNYLGEKLKGRFRGQVKILKAAPERDEPKKFR